ncbi:MAG: response regulator [Caldilineaceae bacterium]
MQPSTKITLLLAENDAEVRSRLQSFLNHAGYAVVVAHSHEQILWTVAQELIDLVLLGSAFASTPALAFCAELRHISAAPIVILAKLQHPDDPMIAFYLGVADYIAMPVHYTLLLAHITAVLRRRRKGMLRHQRWRLLPA